MTHITEQVDEMPQHVYEAEEAIEEVRSSDDLAVAADILRDSDDVQMLEWALDVLDRYGSWFVFDDWVWSAYYRIGTISWKASRMATKRVENRYEGTGISLNRVEKGSGSSMQ